MGHEPKSKIPKTVRLSAELEARTQAFLEKHPSYKYPDIENLAVGMLLDKIDAGAQIVDSGRGKELTNPNERVSPIKKHSNASRRTRSEEGTALAG